MPFEIHGPDGKPVKVNKETSALRTDPIDLSVLGKTFSIITPEITLTTATESFILSIINDQMQDKMVRILGARLVQAASTAGTTQSRLRVYDSEEGLDSTNTDHRLYNLIRGDNDTPLLTIERGEEGAALNTASTEIIDETRVADDADEFIDSAGFQLILAPGQGVAYAVVPPTANTSVAVKLIVPFQIRDDDRLL